MQGKRQLCFNGRMLRLIFLILLSISMTAPADTLSITDGQQGEKYPGKFIWTDLVSTEPSIAADFYQQVFGWQVTAYDEDYLVIRNQGRLIGGIAKNQAEGDEVRTQWISYLSTSDVDGSHELLVSAGAEAVLEPIEVDGRGKFGIYVGPDGGVFGVLDAADGDPEERGAGIGDWIWIELWSKRPEVAAGFYEDLGYSVARNWASDNENDKLLVAGDYARGGIVEGHPKQKNSAWLLYIRVADVTGTLELAKANGGEVVLLEGEFNSSGEIALISDPTGGIVAVYQYPDQEEIASE